MSSGMKSPDSLLIKPRTEQQQQQLFKDARNARSQASSPTQRIRMRRLARFTGPRSIKFEEHSTMYHFPKSRSKVIQRAHTRAHTGLYSNPRKPIAQQKIVERPKGSPLMGIVGQTEIPFVWQPLTPPHPTSPHLLLRSLSLKWELTMPKPGKRLETVMGEETGGRRKRWTQPHPSSFPESQPASCP